MLSTCSRSSPILHVDTATEWRGGQNQIVLTAEGQRALGHTVAQNIFGANDPTGEEIQIGATRFKVTGVLVPKGQTASGNDSDDIILVPYTTASTRLSGRLSIVMGILGGIAGLALGITSAKVLASFTGWETQISPLVMLVAVGFSGAVGVFFGYYPAKKAAALNPIEALRYE
jgi:ABC-type antimicrobial peptide transport system permease subunit